MLRPTQGWHGHAALAALVFFCAAGGTGVRAQDRTPQVLILKDPTPREPDLEKRFPPSTKLQHPATTAAYQQQRLQLVTRAALHLRSMGAVLRQSATQAQVPARIRQEVEVAQAMETLADNVHTAMVITPAGYTAKDQGAATVSPDLAVCENLHAATNQLANLTEALHEEVGRSTAEELRIGILTKSRLVTQLSHCLKLQLQSMPATVN